MLIIHYFNLTHFQNQTDYLPTLNAYLFFEFAFYIYDTIQFAFFLWILFSAKQFHFNFTVLLASIYCIHIMDNISIILMRIHIFCGIDDMNIHQNRYFIAMMYVSIFCVISAMCLLPCLIIERCFATLFVSDYEVKQRRYISFFLVLLLISVGIISCFLVRKTSKTVYVVGLLFSFNVLALLVNVYLRVYNKAQYKKNHSIGSWTSSQYSLAQRYQITENIRTLRMLNLIIFYMGFMNLLLVLTLMMSGIKGISPERQAICSIVLDVCIFVYSNFLSHIIAYCCEKWRRHLSATWKKVGCRSSTVQVAPLCDTFGSEMNVNVTVDSYFNTLRNSWNMRAPVLSK